MYFFSTTCDFLSVHLSVHNNHALEGVHVVNTKARFGSSFSNSSFVTKETSVVIHAHIALKTWCYHRWT